MPNEEEELKELEDVESGEQAEGETEAEDLAEEERQDADAETSAEYEKGFIGKYWMLMLGILFGIIAVAGFVGFRLNYIQVYIMGTSLPYTGIGGQEAIGHGVSSVFLVIGILMVAYWGIKTPDPDEIAVEKLEEVKEEEVEEEALVKQSYKELRELKPEVHKNEEDHLPEHHLSPEAKIEHLAKVYAQGHISKPFYEKNLKKFEEELKREKEHLPPHHLSPREKLEHLDDAYQMGMISKSTYEKNKAAFEEQLKEQPEELDAEIDDADVKGEVAPDMSELDELIIEEPKAGEEQEKKPRKKSLLEEIEDLEDL